MLCKQRPHNLTYYKLLFKIAVLLLIVSITTLAFSQINATSNIKVKSINAAATVQDTVSATFPGGERAWDKYIVKKLKLHIKDLEISKDTGTKVVQFVVDEKGKLSAFDVLKKRNSFLALIVVDALKNGPDWIPATVNGKPVLSICRQPVYFILTH
jgi:hypothetical protein